MSYMYSCDALCIKKAGKARNGFEYRCLGRLRVSVLFLCYIHGMSTSYAA